MSDLLEWLEANGQTEVDRMESDAVYRRGTLNFTPVYPLSEEHSALLAELQHLARVIESRLAAEAALRDILQP